MSKIKILLNGKFEEVETINLKNILNTYAPIDRPFAVEINGEIVPSAKFCDYSIQENDKIEIISAVGGG
jgi:thiamine biosynthesis protein ThiS